MKKNIYILIPIFLAVLLRLYCIPLPPFQIDVSSFQAWADRLAQLGPGKFYAPGYFADYFPGYLYILWFLGKTYPVLDHIFSQSRLFEYYLKFSTNLLDFGAAFLIYKIFSKKDQLWGLAASFLYLINPAVIFNSSIWGQVDSVASFFLLLTTYLLLEVKNLWSFSILSGLAFLIKPQGISALLVLAVSFLRRTNLKKYWLLALAPAVALLVAAPFFPSDPLFGVYHLFLQSSSTYPYTSMFAYNFWGYVGWWKSDLTLFHGLTLNTWGYILFAISLLIIILPFFKKGVREEKPLIYLAISLAIFAFFLFPTRIHERYLIYIFPFLIIFAAYLKNLKLIFIYLLLSTLHFLNLWYVYYYYNFVFNNPSLGKLPAFQLLSNPYNVTALITLNFALFFLLLSIYYKMSFKLAERDIRPHNIFSLRSTARSANKL